MALKTKKSKSQLLKPHISLKILLEWANMFWIHFNHLKQLGKFYITILNYPNGFYAHIFSKTRFDFVSFKNPWKLAFKYIKTIIYYKLIKFLYLRKHQKAFSQNGFESVKNGFESLRVFLKQIACRRNGFESMKRDSNLMMNIKIFQKMDSNLPKGDSNL